MYVACTCILGEEGLTGVPGCLGDPASFTGTEGRLSGLEEVATGLGPVHILIRGRKGRGIEQ